MKMIPERKALLTAALRSEEYQQGRHRLLTKLPSGNQQYCCLGVACEVYRKETGDGSWVSRFSALEFRTGDRDRGADLELPVDVAEWYGLPVESSIDEATDPRVTGTIEGKEKPWPLSTLNDSGEFSFSDIADLIDEQL